MAEISDEALKKLVDALGQAQAFNQAHSYILTEVVSELARRQPDPEKYLAAMFERISARSDQFPVEKEAHPVNAEFRSVVENFFVHAGKRLRKQGEEPPSDGAPVPG